VNQIDSEVESVKERSIIGEGRGTTSVDPDDLLPQPEEAPRGTILWSERAVNDNIQEDLQMAYDEVIRWRRNLFMTPSGKAGDAFVSELARLYRSYGESTTLEPIAIMAAMAMPSLLLQKPFARSKTKDHIKCLEKRLEMWKEGRISELVVEGRCIQQRLGFRRSTKDDENEKLCRTFSTLMRQGKVKSAMRLLSRHEGMILDVNSCLNSEDGNTHTVLDELKTKHPPKGTICPEAVVENEDIEFHPVIFDSIDGEAIQSAALRTNGAAGPSGIDADGWKRLCTSFRRHSSDLCNSLALVAKKLSSTYVDPKGLATFTASRLIAIDKQPGVRPIAIGEVVRRIISKAILAVVKTDILEVTGSIQLCAGQDSGCEAAVHAMRVILQDESTEAALLVDAQNAFNCLNRQLALVNIHRICPSIAATLTNLYREDANLYVQNETVHSCEGVMQGDPLAMAMFALGVTPLIRELQGIRQIWFADDAASGGSLESVYRWWNKLMEIGPRYGYHPNPKKTWLIVKEENAEAAHSLLLNSGVNITTSGHRHLGAALGNSTFVREFVVTKVENWRRELEVLCTVARRDPHAAYAAVTHGLTSRWQYLMRTIPGISDLFMPLEETIRCRLIPLLTGHENISDVERNLLALPCRLGGMGLINPTEISDEQYNSSRSITSSLVDLIMEMKYDIPQELISEVRVKKSQIRRDRRTKQDDIAAELQIPNKKLKRNMEFAKEKGSSIWLTTLPLEKHGFALSRSEFKDAIALRYGWLPERLPLACACDTPFTVEHALSCPKGAFPTCRHNELRDITATVLSEVCPDVCIEPILQPVDGFVPRYASANTEDNARVDVRVKGFWGSDHQSTFLDVKVFNPSALSYRNTQPASCYIHHERIKKRNYEQRINEIEHGSFTPLIFSTSGGMGKAASIFYKRLGGMLAEKRHQPYSNCMRWLRCHLNFSLLRSSIMCLRGSRSGRFPCTPDSLRLATSECRI
jgi:hypothetical protein